MTATLLLLALTAAADPPAGFPKFETQEIAKDLKIGYAVVTADVNGDKKPDIVVVDQKRVVWYENPTWKVRTIITDKTKPDNVCIAPADIDGDGKIDFVLGAGWKPSDTTTPGTLQWLSRGKTLDDEWTVHPIPCDEPTVHRVKIWNIESPPGKPYVIMAPLQGRGSSAKGNWTDGRPVRILAYPIPSDPTKPASWKPEVICESLYVVHNFAVHGWPRAVSYDGVTRITKRTGTWTTEPLGTGDQSNPKGSRGSSEIAVGRGPEIEDPAQPSYHLPVATIEPWHGNRVVVYPNGTGKRVVIDDRLRWGHAVAFADLDGDKIDELVAGVRDNPNPKQGDTFTEKCGVRLYRNTDGLGVKWDRMLLDEGGVAVEDLTAADLNGDGKPDIVAVGRATGNCRVYWNRGVAK